MKILVTGFTPFGGEKINPSYEAVKLLPKFVDNNPIITLEVPTVFDKCDIVLKAAIIKHNPDVVICVGQAGGKTGLAIEKVAINIAEGRIPDNEGNQPDDMTIEPNGENAYFASIPTKAIVKHLTYNGIPAFMSYSAGTYVCNFLMYKLLYMIDNEFKNIKGGFIHVPYIPSQAAGKSRTPSMDLSLITKGLVYAIEAIIDNQNVK